VGLTEVGAERRTLIDRAVRAWTGELIDLGGRNTLLYYRDLKQGTLDLGPASPASTVAVDQLLSSRTMRLSTLFGETSISSAARRARAVKAKATENFEERGLQTTYLAWGMATWINPRTATVPAAPILLRQAALKARGGTGEDFDISLPGEWEVNPTLLHLLRTDFDVDLDGSELLELFDPEQEPPNPSPIFDQLAKTCSAMAGFSVENRMVLGNFSYAKLPMVLDLQTATDLMARSELICAIAGDDQARDAIRARGVRFDVAAGADVTRRWDADRFFYLILAGRFDVMIGSRLIRTLGPGDHFGELAARDWGGGYGYARLATVRCTEPGRLVRLTSEDLRWLTDTEPTVKARLALAEADRLRNR